MRVLGIILFFLISHFVLFAQTPEEEKIQKDVLDSLYIVEVEEKLTPAKVLHAEPLYIDLIRDLGARKGEKEWNVGFGLTDDTNYDRYEALVEYEWAPVNRLGLEVELPFTMYFPTSENGQSPSSRLNSLKLAAQYSFLVSEKRKTTLAVGYIHEFELNEFKKYNEERVFVGNVYNPFFIAAKRWGQNWHTLMYTGPAIENHYNAKANLTWEIHSNVHYMITGTRNFIGIEFNKEVTAHDFDMTIRPQMRIGISDNLLIGIVTGIPVKRENERFSTFFRLIYEPKNGH